MTYDLLAGLDEWLPYLTPVVAGAIAHQLRKGRRRRHKQRYDWAFDNGHGRLEGGKHSPVLSDGTIFFEWEWNRMIVRPVVARLQALGVSAWNVVPEDDVASFLRQRVRRINQRQSQLPKLAVSVHANAWSPADAPLQFTSPSGTETFYCPGSVRGKKLAELFQRHLVAALGLKDRGIKDSPAMYITRKTIPVTVLLEIGFFTNLVEVAKLRDPVFQEKVIEAIIATVLHVEKHGL